MVHPVMPRLCVVFVGYHSATYTVGKNFQSVVNGNSHVHREDGGLIGQPVIGAVRPYLLALEMLRVVPPDKIETCFRLYTILEKYLIAVLPLQRKGRGDDHLFPVVPETGISAFDANVVEPDILHRKNNGIGMFVQHFKVERHRCDYQRVVRMYGEVGVHVHQFNVTVGKSR